MTLPMDAVAVGTDVTGSAVVGATVGLVVVDPAQAVSETKPARLRSKKIFRIKYFIDKSFERLFL
jgi:hypothetical protein